MKNYTDAHYTELLREHSLKATPQRIAITDLLYAYGHISIDQLYEKMLEKFNSISLATIYKNIHLMLENSFVQEVKVPHAKSVFELTKEAHSHLVCSECGTIEDISIDLTEISKRAESSSTFEIHSAAVVFDGICSNCKK